MIDIIKNDDVVENEDNVHESITTYSTRRATAATTWGYISFLSILIDKRLREKRCSKM